MMAECCLRAEAFGYRYSGFELDPAVDLTPADLGAPGGVPPARFKPGLIRKASVDVPEGEMFAWLDGDAILVRPLEFHPSLGEFDVAVTLRIQEEIGVGRDDTNDINSGVIFFRQNHRTRAFLHGWEWATRFEDFTGDQHALSVLLRHFCGFESSAEFKGALGRLPIEGLHVVTLPALWWNCWYFDRPEHAQARILHFKTGLREQHPWLAMVDRLVPMYGVG